MTERGWNDLSDTVARDPLGAIYEIQLQINATAAKREQQDEKLNYLKKRLEFLRNVVRTMLGNE